MYLVSHPEQHCSISACIWSVIPSNIAQSVHVSGQSSRATLLSQCMYVASHPEQHCSIHGYLVSNPEQNCLLSACIWSVFPRNIAQLMDIWLIVPINIVQPTQTDIWSVVPTHTDRYLFSRFEPHCLVKTDILNDVAS